MGKGEITKQRIVETAADLFHEKGINVVSVGDVLIGSKTGKSQFYSHFKSRDELVRTVLEHNQKRILEHIAVPIGTWNELRNFLFTHYEKMRECDFERGCPFGTAAYALQPHQDEERIPLEKILDAMRKNIQAFLLKQKWEGRLNEDASPIKLSNFAIAAIQGGMLISLVEKKGSALLFALEETFAHLESAKKTD